MSTTMQEAQSPAAAQVVGFIPTQRTAGLNDAVLPFEEPAKVEMPTCYECGNDDGPYDGLRLDCEEILGADADVPDPRLPVPLEMPHAA